MKISSFEFQYLKTKDLTLFPFKEFECLLVNEWMLITHSSVVSLGRPFGSVVRPLLLQRTTVSRQEHSAGHLRTGEQLFSLLPENNEHINENRRKTKHKTKHDDKVKDQHTKQFLSHHLHRQNPGQLHPGWESPSRNKDSGSEGFQSRSVSSSASRRARPGDSYS